VGKPCEQLQIPEEVTVTLASLERSLAELPAHIEDPELIDELKQIVNEIRAALAP
jgi:DNA-binding GntR family transcriptional regulator